MYHSTTISAAILLLASVGNAQTTGNAVNSFISEAFSVYTEVTSILASDALNTASSTSSSSSTTASASSSTLTTSTSSSPTSTRPSSTSGTAAAASTSAAAAHSGGLSGTDLAIVLGCVLGALALGLLALVLVICCRRRRRSRNGSPELLLPDGKEIESWRSHRNRPASRDGLIDSTDNNYRNENAGMPNMAKHPAFANDRNHQNPFVPVPPAPRRSAPNSRAGLTDATVPGQEPFISKPDHHRRDELAVGVGGAALGAAALHHHEENKDNSANDGYDAKPAFAQRPVPDTAYPTTTTNDDAYALNKLPSRKSGEMARPYNGDDYGYGHGTGHYEAGQRGIRQPNTSAPLSPFNAAGHHRGPSGEVLVAGAGAGALGGAALANHHNRNHSNSAPRRSYDSAKTPGPNALLDHNKHAMPQPIPMQDNAARDLVSPISSDSYSSALGGNHTLSGSTALSNAHHIPSEMPGDVPTPPPSSSARHSFGTNTQEQNRPSSYSSGAPAAAALAYPNHRRNQTPPNLPGRSPKRTRFSDDPDQAFAAGARNSNSDSTGNTSSEDSTWRLSSGMPGGWGRNPSSQRRDSSPAANSEHLRNAGINPVGRTESPMRQSLDGRGNWKEAEIGGFEEEEEEKVEMERERRGRQSMGSEWGGDAGYDGYEGGHGVGRAM